MRAGALIVILSLCAGCDFIHTYLLKQDSLPEEIVEEIIEDATGIEDIDLTPSSEEDEDTNRMAECLVKVGKEFF